MRHLAGTASAQPTRDRVFHTLAAPAVLPAHAESPRTTYNMLLLCNLTLVRQSRGSFPHTPLICVDIHATCTVYSGAAHSTPTRIALPSASATPVSRTCDCGKIDVVSLSVLATEYSTRPPAFTNPNESLRSNSGGIDALETTTSGLLSSGQCQSSALAFITSTLLSPNLRVTSRRKLARRRRASMS